MNKKIVSLIVVLGVLFLGVFLVNHQKEEKTEPMPITNPSVPGTDPPKIISTKPDPLENTIVSATEVIEITFNRPLENKGEFKLRVDPKTDFKIELSGDRKTAKIIPVQPYELGKTYTIFIGTETKFDGFGRWGEEKIFHVKTVAYRGV